MVGRSPSSRRHLLSPLVALLLFAGACGADSGGGDGANAGATGAAGSGDPSASFATTVQPLLHQACNCHQSEPILMAPFSLKAADAYANIVSHPSMQLPSMNLVEPGVLNASYLWHKVNGTQLEVGGQGKIMPFTVPLRPDELQIIERWIAAGAPP